MKQYTLFEHKNFVVIYEEIMTYVEEYQKTIRTIEQNKKNTKQYLDWKNVRLLS